MFAAVGGAGVIAEFVQEVDLPPYVGPTVMRVNHNLDILSGVLNSVCDAVI
jgi:hypothetical protein